VGRVPVRRWQRTCWRGGKDKGCVLQRSMGPVCKAMTHELKRQRQTLAANIRMASSGRQVQKSAAADGSDCIRQRWTAGAGAAGSCRV
jgi:hypothetical protein